MKTHAVLQILLVVGTAELVSSASFSSTTEATAAAAAETNVTSEEEKLLLECKHSDYRTYIKCLRRQKRHHYRPDEHADFDHDCMEGCLKKCGSKDHEECDKKCAHCLKKTRHRHQIITEYETECVSGDCGGNNSGTAALPTTNITTSIDIKNIINTGYNHTCCPSCKPPTPCPPWWTHPPTGPHPPTGGYPPYPHPPPPGGPYPPYPHPPPPGSPYPPYPPYPPHQPYPPYVPYSPHLTLVPQLTLGLGLGFPAGAPCPWPPCPIPQPVHPTNPSGMDCSGCGNPFFKFKCDVSCYAVDGDSRRENPCQSPHCVGEFKARIVDCDAPRAPLLPATRLTSLQVLCQILGAIKHLSV